MLLKLFSAFVMVKASISLRVNPGHNLNNRASTLVPDATYLPSKSSVS